MDTITTIRDLLKCDGSAHSVTVALTPNERRLIAAAPELLEALQDIVFAFQNNIGSFDEDQLASWDKARVAIAKVTGVSINVQTAKLTLGSP